MIGITIGMVKTTRQKLRRRPLARFYTSSAPMKAITSVKKVRPAMYLKILEIDFKKTGSSNKAR